MRRAISASTQTKKIEKYRKIKSEQDVCTINVKYSGKKLYYIEFINYNIYSIIAKISDGEQYYAYKILNGSTEQMETDFQKEYQILKELSSKYIVNFLGIFDSTMGVGFLFDFFPNGSLYSFLIKSSKLAPEVYFKLGKQAIKAVCYLHNMKPAILHRDLKSLNYLVGKTLKLCDFNLSRKDIDENKDSTLKNWRSTPMWSAPEIVSSVFTLAADIYALTIVLWEIHTHNIKEKYTLPFIEEYSLYRLIFHPTRRPDIIHFNEQYSDLFTYGWHSEPDKRPTCNELLTKYRGISP